MVELSAPRWKRDGARVELAEEDGGEQVLAGVLLLVVGTAGWIHGTADTGAGRKGLADEVPDLSGFVFVNALDGDLERGAAGRGGDEQAGVPGLAAAFGVEGGAVERDLPELRAVRGGVGIFFDEADVGDARGELEDGGVVVEALGRSRRVGLRGHSISAFFPCFQIQLSFFLSIASFFTIACRVSTSTRLPRTKEVRWWMDSGWRSRTRCVPLVAAPPACSAMKASGLAS